MGIFFSITISLSLLTTSVVAGTVFAYSNSVMPGLRKADDRTFVLANRFLNAAVDNPIFLIISNLALVAQIGLVIFSALMLNTPFTVIFSFALLAYIVTLLITFIGNLPLNRTIINASLKQSDDDWKKLRNGFENRWKFFNLLRNLSCFTSLILIIITLIMLISL